MTKREFEKFTPQDIIKPENIIVESLIDSHMIYTGRISGQQYEWHGAGRKVLVRAEDVPELLGKRLKNRCCGQSEIKLFQLGG